MKQEKVEQGNVKPEVKGTGRRYECSWTKREGYLKPVPEEVILAHSGMVHRLAGNLARNYKMESHLEDLIQVGFMGLMHGYRTFDPLLGYKLLTHAAWWMRAYTSKYVEQNISLVGISNTVRGRASVWKGEIRREVSLDEPVGSSDHPDERDHHSRIDFIRSRLPSVEIVLDRTQRIFLIRGKLRSMVRNEMEGALLEERLLSSDPTTFRQLAERFGVSKQALGQSEQRFRARIKREFSKVEWKAVLA